MWMTLLLLLPHSLPSALARGNINRDLFSGYMYVCTYVRSSAQAQALRHVRARAYTDRLGAYRKLGSCETRFIAFEPITQDRLAAS